MGESQSGNVGDEIKVESRAWTFGGDVPRVFDRHVQRSVPLYQEGHHLIVRLSDFFVSSSSVVYDLGCSTGELLIKLAARHSDPSVRFIGVDREAGMIEQAREKCKHDQRISFVVSEIRDVEMEATDMVVSYYTMQFNRPKHRQETFDQIYSALNWGGAFLLFEKVRASDARFQDMITQLYTDFKQDMGYSDEEILSKARSLKGVLEPFSTQANLDLMSRAGFKDVVSILKYLCFEGFLAVK